jgi:hypothetical protein
LPVLNLPHLRSFPCPNCGNYIHTERRECNFCRVPVSSEAAETFADLQEKVNSAYSDAITVRHFATVFLASYLLSLFFVRCITGLIAIATFFLVPILLVRWQVRYGQIVSNDPDLKTARRWRNVAILMWGIPALVYVFLMILAMIAD